MAGFILQIFLVGGVQITIFPDAQFKDPVGQGVHELYIVRCKKHGAVKLEQAIVQGRDGFEVQVKCHITGLYNHTEKPSLIELLQVAPKVPGEINSLVSMLRAMVHVASEPTSYNGL